MSLPAGYVGILPVLQDAARKCGYALGLHGSINRDMDLIAVPWTAHAVPAEELIQALLKAVVMIEVHIAGEFERPSKTPAYRPHGRRTWLISLGAGAVIDVSVMPRYSAPGDDIEPEAVLENQPRELPVIQYPKYRRCWVDESTQNPVLGACSLQEVGGKDAARTANYLIFRYVRRGVLVNEHPAAEDIEARYVAAYGEHPVTHQSRKAWKFSEDFDAIKQFTPNEIAQLKVELADRIRHIGEYVQGQLLTTPWRCHRITHVVMGTDTCKDSWTTTSYTRTTEYDLLPTATYRGYFSKIENTHDDVVIE